MTPTPPDAPREGSPMNPYSSLCDDFGVYAYLNTKMDLPQGRETVLHFFDSLQKTFPQMTDFDCRESGEYVLEEDREQGTYRWVGLDGRRFSSGYMNPPVVSHFLRNGRVDAWTPHRLLIKISADYQDGIAHLLGRQPPRIKAPKKVIFRVSDEGGRVRLRGHPVGAGQK